MALPAKRNKLGIPVSIEPEEGLTTLSGAGPVDSKDTLTTGSKIAKYTLTTSSQAGSVDHPYPSKESFTAEADILRPADLFARIAPELRNNIFESALVEEHILDITTPEPSLTRINEQYRGEALGIYYGKNVFQCIVPNYRHQRLRRIHELDRRYGPLNVHFLHDLRADTPTLKRNLLSWLKEAFDNKSVGLGFYQGREDWFEWKVSEDRVASLFIYSRVLRDKHDMKWEDACELVERFLEVAGVCGEPGSEGLNW